MDFLFDENDKQLFFEGIHSELYHKMGAHYMCKNGIYGTHFILYAPHAVSVCIIHDKNNFKKWQHIMEKNTAGIFELFIPGLKPGNIYQYVIKTDQGKELVKADPYSFSFVPKKPHLSIITDESVFNENDRSLLLSTINTAYEIRNKILNEPIAIYEVHLGSWLKNKNGKYKNYRTLAHELAKYVTDMGYTHIELFGISEYPYDPSWGYQVTGYFSPTTRYGTIDDFLYFVNYLHSKKIKIILDFVPAHFPKDDYSLSMFDGHELYESSDPLLSSFPEWGTSAFDHSKNTVRNFLISSACMWIKRYKVDALRVDAVCAILYTNFSRPDARKSPDGTYNNYPGMTFLKELNKAVASLGSYLIAEDSSIHGGITDTIENNGFGFLFKWNMGWMNETLSFLSQTSNERYKKMEKIIHPIDYCFSENYVLPVSHDEVVYGKGSMYGKIPGDCLEKYGCLKVYYTMMFTYPGKKLLFMGCDMPESFEWNFNGMLDWNSNGDNLRNEVKSEVKELLQIYKTNKVLFNDFSKNTFKWLRKEKGVIAYIRKAPDDYNDALIIICNFTYNDHKRYRFPSFAKQLIRVHTTYPEYDQPCISCFKKDTSEMQYAGTIHLRPYEAVILKKER